MNCVCNECTARQENELFFPVVSEKMLHEHNKKT
jgi:hypothetical protein